jgi:hypothetical protein
MAVVRLSRRAIAGGPGQTARFVTPRTYARWFALVPHIRHFCDPPPAERITGGARGGERSDFDRSNTTDRRAGAG